ncbi:MAG: hypothetical protein IJY39_06405 [Clostridia bacterium]|nr:hypothetical protein [Clostridia bacterium]
MKRVISFSIFVLILMMALTSLCSCQEERCYHCSASNYGVRMVKKEYGGEQYYVCKDCAELKVTSGFDVAVQCLEEAGYSVSTSGPKQGIYASYEGLENKIYATDSKGNSINIYYFESEEYAMEAYEKMTDRVRADRLIVGKRGYVVFVGSPDAIRAANRY